jgi:hypothetical protein
MGTFLISVWFASGMSWSSAAWRSCTQQTHARWFAWNKSTKSHVAHRQEAAMLLLPFPAVDDVFEEHWQRPKPLTGGPPSGRCGATPAESP